MAEVTKTYCDIQGCNNECKDHKEINMTVVFDTDKTEGRVTKPHIDMVRVDICEDCINEIISDRKMISATGAMGHNTYIL